MSVELDSKFVRNKNNGEEGTGLKMALFHPFLSYAFPTCAEKNAGKAEGSACAPPMPPIPFISGSIDVCLRAARVSDTAR